MKITIESTAKIVEINCRKVRVWQGETADGIPVHAFIAYVAPLIPKDDPDIDARTADFTRDLQRMADPSPIVDGIPLRMII